MPDHSVSLGWRGEESTVKATVCHRFGSPEVLGLLEAGKLTPVIDRQDELAEASAALTGLGAGHARAR